MMQKIQVILIPLIRVAIARALLKQPKILIFDEATSSLDAQTAEHFAATINQLKGKVTMLFITHALPKNLLVDEVVRIGINVSGLSAVGNAPHDSHDRQESGETMYQNGRINLKRAHHE